MTSNGTLFIANGRVNTTGNKLLGSINIGTTGRQRWTVNLILNYDCKSLKNDSLAKTFCKFIYFVMYHVMMFFH